MDHYVLWVSEALASSIAKPQTGYHTSDTEFLGPENVAFEWDTESKDFLADTRS